MHELEEGRHGHFIHFLCICVPQLARCTRILFRRARIVAPAFRCSVRELADFVARSQACVFIWRI